MNPDFNRLHLFYQVFRCASIAKAARELFVTQSAVSQNLQKLEQELHISLFHRFPKKLVPTAAAEQLFHSIRPFFSTIDATIRSIHSSDMNPQGLLRIGAPPVFGAEFLPEIIAGFNKKYPLVKFQVSLGEQAVIAGAYRNSELDLALVDIFGTREEDEWNLVLEPLIDEPLVLIGSSKYISIHFNTEPVLEQLLNCKFIAYKSQAPELTEWFSHHFSTSVNNLEIVLTVENVQTVINAVRSNLGLGIVPLYLVQQSIQKKELTIINNNKGEMRSRISLLRHPGRKPGIAERLFLEMIRNKFTQ